MSDDNDESIMEVVWKLRARVGELEAALDHYRFALEEISRVKHWWLDRDHMARAARALREAIPGTAALDGAAPDQEETT